MAREAELSAKLKQCDPEVQNYVSAIEAENSKLQLKIAKLQAKNFSSENRIAALEEQTKEIKYGSDVSFSQNSPSDKEIIEKMISTLQEYGYRVIKDA